MNKLKKLFVLLISVQLIVAGCDDNNDDVKITPVVLTDSQLFTSLKASEIRSFVQSRQLPISSTEIKYDVDIYKVTYNTTYKSGTVTASGLVALPKTGQSVGVFSFQHGTISAHSDAPTAMDETDDLLKFYGAIASVGFVGVVPDFIGFGESKNILHPYYVEQATSDAVLDNIRAARELALINKIKLNKRLFLAGYSQGGYATMAAHKAIEQDGIEDLNLIASFPASGGYAIKGMQEYFFGLETYHEPFYLAYVALAYKTYYDWTESLDFMFNDPYASKIPSLFNGTKGGSQINSELTENVADLLRPEILTGIDNSGDYAFIVDAFNENSVNDFVPQIPIYMYHGTSDITVPYQNSVDVYNSFIASGASPAVVTFTPLPFATHNTGITPYIIELTNKLLALK